MPRITVVDDDVDSRNLLDTLLRNKGFIVSLFPSAETFLEQNDHSSDLYILDVNLGGIQGDELCSLIKSEKDKNKPVIIISAHPDIQRISESVCADAYLAKPFSQRKLIEKLKALVDQ